MGLHFGISVGRVWEEFIVEFYRHRLKKWSVVERAGCCDIRVDHVQGL